MCDNCDWEDALAEIACALDDVGEIPDNGIDFAESVGEKLRDIADWIEENQHVTEAQRSAIENMRIGISKWVNG